MDNIIYYYSRAVARSENLGGHVILGGDNVPPLVEIGLTDLTKSGGGAGAPPAPPLATGLLEHQRYGNYDLPLIFQPIADTRSSNDAIFGSGKSRIN